MRRATLFTSLLLILSISNTIAHSPNGTNSATPNSFDEYDEAENTWVVACTDQETFCPLQEFDGDTNPDESYISYYYSNSDVFIDSLSSSDDCIDISNITEDIYFILDEYTANGVNTAFLHVDIQITPQTATNDSAIVCQSSGFVSLDFLLEGASNTGYWNWFDISNGIDSLPFNKSVLHPITYPANETIELLYTGSCETSGHLFVTIVEGEAEYPSNSIQICSELETVNLFDYFEGNPPTGGAMEILENWPPYELSAGNGHNAFYDISASGGQFITCTYTIFSEFCSPQQIYLQVEVLTPLLLPTNTTATVCQSDSLIYLNSLLVGADSTDWNWTDLINGSNIPNPIDFSTFPPGVTIQLIYSAGLDLCETTGFLTITVLPSDAYAGEDATIDICGNANILAMLNHLNGQPQMGGTWIGPDGNPTSEYYNPGTSTQGDYTYIVATTCETDIAVLTVTETDVIGEENNATRYFCTTIGDLMLDTLLNGDVPSGGTWTNPQGDSIGSILDIIPDPFPGESQSGSYTYTLENGDCTGSAALFLVLSSPPYAGGDFYYPFCWSYLDFKMGTLMSQTADSDGQWYDPNDNPIEISQYFETAYYNEGIYKYVVTSEICPNDTGFYNIDIQGPALDFPYSYCNPDDPTLWTAEMEITNGEPPFTSPQGIIIGNTFFSNPMSVLDQPIMMFEITDQSGCTSMDGTQAWDNDNDGICDSGEIPGCQDPLAINYNPLATDPGPCQYGFAGGQGISLNPGVNVIGGIFGESDVFDIQNHQTKPNSDWEFIIFPNPWNTDSPLQFQLSNSSVSNIIIEIYDITGRLVSSNQFKLENNQILFTLPTFMHLDNGTYLISLTDQHNYRKTQPLIIHN